MNYKKIGDLIKEKRIKKGLTQKELADILFITDRAISKWERGISLPDISMLKKICETLDIDINDMLEIKKKDERKKKQWIILTIMLVLVLGIILTFNIKNIDDKGNANACSSKDLKKYYTDNKNNRMIFLNCIDNVYIDDKELKFLLTNMSFDFDLYLTTIKKVNYLYDGGMALYEGENYNFLKCNTLNGNKDIIIGNKNMGIQDFFCQNNYKENERCIYTDIFRVVDILTSYESDDDRYIFVTLDKFQDPNPINVKIHKEFIDSLEKGKYYEFKFIYYNPNNYKIDNDVDIFYNYNLVEISKTDKEGLEQISSNKCEKLTK